LLDKNVSLTFLTKPPSNKLHH